LRAVRPSAALSMQCQYITKYMTLIQRFGSPVQNTHNNCAREKNFCGGPETFARADKTFARGKIFWARGVFVHSDRHTNAQKVSAEKVSYLPEIYNVVCVQQL
jgi:hypothetical protein